MSDSKENQASLTRRELFVRAIPSEVTSEQLQDFFSEVAPVKHAVVVRDRETGESKNFGFVGFGSTDDATAALEKTRKSKLQGVILRAEFAKPRGRQDENKQVSESVEKRRPRLIIRNVPWSLRNPKELEKIFSKYGKVLDAFIPRGENNKMSGFAFVTMRRKIHAQKAIDESKGLEIHGRQVAVDFALSKDKYLKGESETFDSDTDSDDDDEDEDDEVESGDLELADDDEEENSEEKNSEDDEDEEEEDEDQDEPKPKRRAISDDQTVFVRNVPYEATEETLAEHFEQFGPVAYALPVMDKALNQPKGTAFVAFKDAKSADECVENAPSVTSASLLIPDDVDSRYVYEGRILSVTRAVHKDKAANLAEKGAKERLEVLGKTPSKKDKRNLFLLNEGRVTSGSKLAEVIPASEMQIREKSFQLRKKQLTSNPSLHLSMTRLAIRNIPRAMSEKALKALGRTAVVEFAKEVTEKKRQPLSKEEVMRSIHFQDSLGDAAKSKHGVVKQAKIVMEVKGSGEVGRSRGYGFLELRNHKAALMALRWLNGHLVTKEEIGDDDAEVDKKRHLVVEFAVENAQILKRQRDRKFRAHDSMQKKRKAEEEAEIEAKVNAKSEEPKGNVAIGRKRKFKKMRKA